MNVPVIEKEEVRNLLLAIEGAARRLSEVAPTSPEVAFYLEGFRAALMLVAVGLGIPLDFPQPAPMSERLWQEVVTVLTPPDGGKTVRFKEGTSPSRAEELHSKGGE